MTEQAKTYKYFAFISYSRKDSKVAAWLQKRLEWFRFPVKLVPEDRRPPHPRYIQPIYRDKTSLEVTDGHYWTNIRRALEESRYLIVLCSPFSAKSEPVNMEVSHFLTTHGGNASLVVPIIVSGNVTSGGDDTALCPALRELGHTLIDRNLPTMVPDAVTAEQDAWEQGFVSLVSYLLRLERTAIGDHIQRETKRQAKVLRRWLAAVIVLAVTAFVGGVIAYKQKQAADAQTKRAIESERIAKHQKQEAEAQTLRAINAEKATQTQLVETNRQLERSQVEEGKSWLERGRAALNRGDHLGALMLAGRAVGYQGYGRIAQEERGFSDAFPLLLGAPMKDPAAERDRAAENQEATEFINSIRPSYLPVWASVTNGLNSVAFSPDGVRLASGSDDKTIRLWDPATGKQLSGLHGHTGSVKSVAFSPDGIRLASGSADNTIRLWDTAMGRELAILRGHSSDVSSVAFSPNGLLLASGSGDNTIKVWDTAAYKELASIKGHTDRVNSIAFCPDGTRLASSSDDKTIRFWDAVSGKELTRSEGHTHFVFSIAFSPDNTRLASGSRDNTIKLWEATTGKELASLKGHKSYVMSVAFSPDGTRLASGSDDNTIKVWDPVTGRELASLQGYNDVTQHVAFSPDGTRLVSGSWDKLHSSGSTIKIWDVAIANEITMLQGSNGLANSVAFSPDGTYLASGSKDETISFWDASTGIKLANVHGHSSSVNSVAFSPDGTRLASGSNDTKISFWDASTGKKLANVHGHSSSVNSVAFSSDGTRLASSSDDGAIRLWNAATGQELASLRGHTNIVYRVAFSPDGTRLASGSRDAKIKIWEIPSGKELMILQGHNNYVLSVAFSPDGTRLASRSRNNEIKFWDVSKGIELTASSPDAQATAKQWEASDRHHLSPDRRRRVVLDGKQVCIVPNSSTLNLVSPLRAGLLALPGRELQFPEIKQITPMLHVRQDVLAKLADPNLSPKQRAELRMELCTKSGQFRAATALWQRLLQGEWPGFEGATVPKDQAPATIPADSPIRRLYLLALIDATKHPQIHGHPTICQTAAQIAPVLTKEMMATPTISLAMMSLMQTLSKDDSPDMSVPRAGLLKQLEAVATKEWLTVLRGSTGK